MYYSVINTKGWEGAISTAIVWDGMPEGNTQRHWSSSCYTKSEKGWEWGEEEREKESESPKTLPWNVKPPKPMQAAWARAWNVKP